MKIQSQLLRGSPLIALLAPLAGAQSSTVGVKDGDSIGFAAVTGLITKSVNDSGTWLTTVRTDHVDPAREAALLRSDGSIHLREGDLVAGGPIAAFVAHEMLPSGSVVALVANQQHLLNGSTVLFNDLVIADLGEQAHDAPPGVRYSNTTTIRASQGPTGDGTVLLRTRISFLDCLQLLTVDPRGEVLDATTPLIQGGPLAGSPDPILALAESDNAFDLNREGSWITIVRTGENIIGWFDSGIGRVVLDGEILASEGDPSPVPGFAYETLFPGTEVALNDFGDHAFTATLTGPIATDFLIVVNGEKFVQDGDVLPALAPHALSVSSGSPIVLTDSSDLFWFAATTNPDASRDQALMRNRDVIVLEGVSQVGGQTVVHVSSTADAFAVSPSGRFWIGEVVLAGGVDAQLSVDFGSAVPIPGCQPNAGSLALADGLVLAGHTLTLELDGAPAAGMFGFVTTSLAPAGNPCGITLPFGELLIDPLQVVARRVAGVYTGAPLQTSMTIPSSLALVGAFGYTQAGFLDAAGTLPGPDVVLTNALQLEVGAP